MSADGPCRKCEAGEPHGICGEPWRDVPPTSHTLNILREQAEHRRAMLLDKYARRIKDISAARNGHRLLVTHIIPALDELLTEAMGPVRKHVEQMEKREEIRRAFEASHIGLPAWLDRHNAESLALTDAFERAQEKAMAATDPHDAQVATSTYDGTVPAPRSCPTCGPCPGGPGSTPLNETDDNCWRCGRTDLS